MVDYDGWYSRRRNLPSSEGRQSVSGAPPHSLSQRRACAQESRPSLSTQALATAEFIFSVPGIAAQPPFSIRARWSHEAAFLNSISFAAELVCCWNFSTQ